MKLRQIITFLGIIELILLVLHATVYFVVVTLFHISSEHVQIFLAIVLGVMAFSFLASSTLAWRNGSLLTRWFYKLSASWIIVVYFAFLASVLGIVLYAILPLHTHASLLLSIVIFAIAGIVTLYSLVNAEVIRIVHREIKLPGVPEFWKSRHLIFVSDVHLGHIHGTAYSKRVTDTINSLHPEAVFIGGDIFDGVKIDPFKAIKPFAQLVAPLGTYFISGNHDEFRDSSEFFKAIEQSGMKILDAESVTVNGITFTGVDYLKTNSREKFQQELQKISLSSGPNILLKHVPSDLDLAAEKGFNASFSGHTHNGQMYPFGYLARRSYGYNYGLEMLKNMSVLVSSGVGTWGPPGRLGTKSEIVVVHFK